MIQLCSELKHISTELNSEKLCRKTQPVEKDGRKFPVTFTKNKNTGYEEKKEN